jgi:hypothetical protein
MLHNNGSNSLTGQKPMIPPKPKLAQKSNYVIVASDNHQLSTTSTQPINAKSHHKRDDNNTFTIMPSSSLPPPSTNFSDCNDSCCGFLNNPIDSSTTIDNGKMNSFGFTNVSNFILHDQREIEDHIKFADRILSQTFDSSSSPSSGGSRELDIVTKTVAAFEVFEKEENGHHVSLPPTSNMPVGSSKIQEMKSRLFKQNEKQNHSSGELGISINRQQVQKSSKELEKILGMRMKTMTMNPTSTSTNSSLHGREDKLAKRLSRSFDDIDDDNNFTAKSIHKKLNEEMKQKSDKIKEKYLIEKVPAQQHYKDFMVVFLSFYSDNENMKMKKNPFSLRFPF